MAARGNIRRQQEAKTNCPGVLQDVSDQSCGFSLKEVALKDGHFPVKKLKTFEGGGIGYRNASAIFKPLWIGTGSHAKVSFDTTGSFELPEQFMSEFEEAMGDEGLFPEGIDVVRQDLIHLYPDPESTAGGATVAFFDEWATKGADRTSWDANREHPESYEWEKYTKQLVFKSNCVAQQIAIDKNKAEEFFVAGRYLIKEYIFSCGVELEARLIAQMQATNLAMRMVFEQISSLGRCLYPCSGCTGEEQHFKSRKYCGKKIIQPMTLADDGRLGLLSLAISFATAYGKVADSLVNPKYVTYKDIIAKQFGCTYESGLETKLVDTIRLLSKKKVRADRAYTCRAVVAHHRAFERTFLRFVAAIKAWMQTFARDLKYGIITYPCARLFGDPSDTRKFCLREVFTHANGKEIDESASCSRSGES